MVWFSERKLPTLLWTWSDLSAQPNVLQAAFFKKNIRASYQEVAGNGAGKQEEGVCTVRDFPAPDSNDEYMAHQILLGCISHCWPALASPDNCSTATHKNSYVPSICLKQGRIAPKISAENPHTFLDFQDLFRPESCKLDSLAKLHCCKFLQWIAAVKKSA